jgi:hypothetical protein
MEIILSITLQIVLQNKRLLIMEVSFETLRNEVNQLPLKVENIERFLSKKIKVNEQETANVVDIQKSSTPSVSEPNQEKEPSNYWLRLIFEITMGNVPDEIKTKIQDLFGVHSTAVWLFFMLFLFLILKKKK